MGARALGYIGEPRDWDTEARVEGGFLHFLAEGAAISVTGFYARRFGLHNEWWVDVEDRDRLGMSVGLSVFFIHLYIRKVHTYLKYLYFIGLGCLVVLLAVGKGSLSGALLEAPWRALLLLPLSGCLGFVTAKEAFCFQLVEGYVLALV